MEDSAPVAGRATAETPAEAAFYDDFEAGRLAPECFHHRDHVKVAYLATGRYDLPTAIARVRTGLKRLAAAAGRPERYHETITWAFVILVAERRARDRAAGLPPGWEAFAARHPDLLGWELSVLDRYYPRELLMSDLARQTFVLPPPGRPAVL